MEWDDELLAELYNGQPVTADYLPYTKELNDLVGTYCARTGQSRDHAETVRRLIHGRKHNPDFKKKGTGRPRKLPEFDDQLLWRLYADVPALDQLAYTDEFDRLAARYCAESGHARTHEQIFRRLMTLRRQSQPQ